MGMSLRFRLKQCFVATGSLSVAAAIWLPALHLFFRPKLSEFRQLGAVAPKAQELANRHLHLWEDPTARASEIAAMRSSNAEWDFMGRTFLVLSLANMSLDEPGHAHRDLSVIDQIIDETLRLGTTLRVSFFFLMDYAKARIKARPARSTFLDGEIAIMLKAIDDRAQDGDEPLLTSCASTCSWITWGAGLSCAARVIPMSAGCSATPSARLPCG